MVSIAQSRKALLPPARKLVLLLSINEFQSLSREKPFCHTTPRARERAVQVGFNRSVAKSPFATSSARYSLRASLEFQSLSREKPFCHGQSLSGVNLNLRVFQSLSREKPFCHVDFQIYSAEKM